MSKPLTTEPNSMNMLYAKNVFDSLLAFNSPLTQTSTPGGISSSPSPLSLTSTPLTTFPWTPILPPDPIHRLDLALEQIVQHLPAYNPESVIARDKVQSGEDCVGKSEGEHGEDPT